MTAATGALAVPDGGPPATAGTELTTPELTQAIVARAAAAHAAAQQPAVPTDELPDEPQQPAVPTENTPPGEPPTQTPPEEPPTQTPQAAEGDLDGAEGNVGPAPDTETGRSLLFFNLFINFCVIMYEEILIEHCRS